MAADSINGNNSVGSSERKLLRGNGLHAIDRILAGFVLPLVGYAVCYAALTWPLITRWSSAFFVYLGDGPQTVWNVWWVREAITRLHVLPWHTDFVHWPGGATLLLHSLTPVNGLMFTAFSWFLPDVQAFNLLIVLAFAGSGITAFWLAHHLTRSYWPSLTAGYVFTFSSLHFAHAPGHLHQITTQFLPLFVLALVQLLERPGVWRAAWAGLALFLVLLSDQYQFVFGALIGILLLGWFVVFLAPREWRRWVPALVAFALVTLATCGPLVFATAFAAREPLKGTHYSYHFTTDLFGWLVPSRVWIYSNLTRWYWQPVGHYEETSVSIGLAALVAAIAGVCRRGGTGQLRGAYPWLFLAVCFCILSMGPTLHLLGRPIWDWMPYDLLEWLIPPLAVGGCPSRMMVITQLCVAVLAAMGLARLASVRSKSRRAALGGAFVVALGVESQPRLSVTLPAWAPPWVVALRDSPVPGAVIALRTEGNPMGMYYQTVHRRPIMLGELARVPMRVQSRSEHVVALVDAGRFDELRAMGFGLLVVGASRQPLELPVIYADREVRIYRVDAASRQK
jgi:hypothetical protein